MKPKYRRFKKLLLPAVIVLPAMSGISRAATIFPDGFGNVTATAGNSGANNISTGNGFVPVVITVPPGEKIITIESGVTLNPVGTDVVEVSIQDSIGASYTIINHGTLQSDNGAANYGISTADGFGSTPSITVENTGWISGAGAIRANDQLFLTNSGTLVGNSAVDAAVFVKNGGTIYNTGTIDAIVHGIQGESGTLQVTNYNSINGDVFDGINTTGVLDLNNSVDYFDSGASTISGGRHGVLATGAGAIIDNQGIITGDSGNGVQVGASGLVTNYTTYYFTTPYGGNISGGVNGVVGTDGLTVLNQYVGTISGETGYGISAGFNADIDNFGTIVGGERGINLSSGNINNVGLIQGDFYGVYVAVGGAATTLTNSGRIVTDGGTAFLGDVGVDTVNLVRNDPSLSDQGLLPFAYNGSEVWGNIYGDAGVDILNFSGGLTVAGGASNVVYGNVEMEEINKTDGGVAFIGDIDDLYEVDADEINITGGGLYINGYVEGLNVANSTINAGGTAVGGTGIWNADVNVLAGGISAGSIPIHLDADPENAVGTLTINGDVVHSAGSHLRVDIIPGVEINEGVDSDLIVQNGTATYDINGAAIRVSPTNLDEIIFQGVHTIVDSEELIIGNTGDLVLQINGNAVDTGFISTAYQDWIDAGASGPIVVSNTIFTNYFAEAFVAGTDINLGIDYVNFDFSALPGISDNEVNLVLGLADAVLAGSAEAEDLAASLLYSDLDSVLDVLGGIVAPAEAALAYSTSIINTNYRLHRQVADHLAVARSSSSVTVPMGTSVETAKGGTVETPVTTRGNVWGSFSYDRQDYDGDEGDFDADSGAFTAGVDYRVAPNFIIGGILDGSKTDSDEFGDIDSFRAGFYGSWGAPTGVYVDFLAAYGWHELDFTDASSIQSALTVGYAMGDETVKHGPFAGLEYQNVDFDSFNSGLLDVEDFDVDSLRALVGYRVNASYGVFRPYASLAYAHEFEDGSNSVDASVFGGGFRVSGGELGSAVIATLGTGISVTPTLTINVGYRGEISVESEGLSSHGGSLGVNWAF